VPPGTDARLLGAVLNDLDDLKQRVGVHDRVLSPAFAPAAPRKDTSMSRGPGDYPREPVIQHQASSRSDPWAGDPEHSEAFMQAVRDGVPVAELRRRSDQDARMRAEAARPSPVMWVTASGEAVVDGSAVQAPVQRSVVAHPWSDFPDHQSEGQFRADHRPPDFLTARQQAPQVPGRPEPEIRPGP
jgi:hypothetical protein